MGGKPAQDRRYGIVIRGKVSETPCIRRHGERRRVDRGEVAQRISPKIDKGNKRQAEAPRTVTIDRSLDTNATRTLARPIERIAPRHLPPNKRDAGPQRGAPRIRLYFDRIVLRDNRNLTLNCRGPCFFPESRAESLRLWRFLKRWLWHCG
jgi:hypothetical protein